MIENDILCCDAFQGLYDLKDETFDLCITDPPYFLDKLDNTWNEVALSQCDTNHIGNLPPGMKFDRRQTIDLKQFYFEVSKEIFRILKPGAFFLTFSSPRLYHAIASAIDDAGFEIRDMITWQHNQGQPKFFGMEHFIRQKNLSTENMDNLISQTNGWVTPQIPPTFEPICVAQKPKNGTFLDNFQQYGIGLMRRSSGLRGTIISPKPKVGEKGYYNDHVSVKPLNVIQTLIEAFTQSDGNVIDPFIGSGTTAVAAQRTGRRWYGFEREKHYCEIAKKRLNEKTIDSFF